MRFLSAGGWGKTWGNDQTSICGVGRDSRGNYYIAGTFSGTVASLHAPGGTDVFLLRLSNMELNWIDYGKVFLGGGFLGTLDLGSGMVATNPGADHAIFLAELDTTGTPLRLRSYASPGEKSARAVAPTAAHLRLPLTPYPGPSAHGSSPSP